MSWWKTLVVLQWQEIPWFTMSCRIDFQGSLTPKHLYENVTFDFHNNLLVWFVHTLTIEEIISCINIK